MQAHVRGNFQDRISVASLRCAFSDHYLSAPTLFLVTADVVSFQILRPTTSALRPTLARLRGGTGNEDSGSDNERDDDAANPILPWSTESHANAATDPPSPVRPCLAHP